MEGRNYHPPSELNSRNHHQVSATDRLLNQPSRLSSSELRTVEDRIATQAREIQTLLHDNQRLAVIHVTLKQELTTAEQEIRHLSETAASVKAERDAQVLEVHRRSVKMEEAARSAIEMRAELDRVRSQIQELRSNRNEMAEKLKDMNGELVRSRLELQELPAIRAETQAVQKEILRGRTAIEYETKMLVKNCELSEIMEQHIISLKQEAEKLRAELANNELRAAAAAVVTPPAPEESHTISIPPGTYNAQ